jgi:hypothetical protein
MYDQRPITRWEAAMRFFLLPEAEATMVPRKPDRTTERSLEPPALGAVQEAVARRVYREFLDTPHLQVTPGEAKCLFGLKESQCEMVLECLTEFGVLTRLPSGSYARPVSE